MEDKLKDFITTGTVHVGVLKTALKKGTIVKFDGERSLFWQGKYVDAPQMKGAVKIGWFKLATPKEILESGKKETGSVVETPDVKKEFQKRLEGAGMEALEGVQTKDVKGIEQVRELTKDKVTVEEEGKIWDEGWHWTKKKKMVASITDLSFLKTLRQRSKGANYLRDIDKRIKELTPKRVEELSLGKVIKNDADMKAAIEGKAADKKTKMPIEVKSVKKEEFDRSERKIVSKEASFDTKKPEKVASNTGINFDEKAKELLSGRKEGVKELVELVKGQKQVLVS